MAIRGTLAGRVDMAIVIGLQNDFFVKNMPFSGWMGPTLLMKSVAWWSSCSTTEFHVDIAGCTRGAGIRDVT